MKLGTAEAQHLNWINFLGKLRANNCGKAILDMTNSVDIFIWAVREYWRSTWMHFFISLRT